MNHMKLTRRSLLKTAAASGILATPAGGLVAQVAGAGQAAGASATPLYAVVSPGKARSVFENYHQAYRRAGEIRIASALQTTHLQCSQALADEVRSGLFRSFVEIDGVAVTSGEAELRGGQFLREAMDRAKVRRQLENHCRQLAVNRVRAHDRSVPGRWFYAADEDGQLLAVFDDRERAEVWREVAGSCPLHLCTPELGEALALALRGEGRVPDIVRTSEVHLSQSGHELRMLEDPLYRFAFGGSSACLTGADIGAGVIAFDPVSRWIYGAGRGEDDALEAAEWALTYMGFTRLRICKASRRLVSAVAARGLELPPFWSEQGGLARHESEMSRPRTVAIPARRLRPPVPEWKKLRP
jgi:hypothetical protein